MKKHVNHNRQNQTRREIRESKKRKGLKGLITPAVVYYIVARPIIDLAIAWMQSLGLL